MELPTESAPPSSAPLPPPPPPPAAPAAPAAAAPLPTRAPAPGELTSGWRVVTALVWAGVFVAMIAVWKTSTELGRNTWWLGPFGDPMPPPVRMLPYVPPTLMVVIALNRVRFVPHAGVVAAAALAAIGAGDLGDAPRLAALQLVIAGAGLLVSIAAFAGRYRTPTSHTPTHPHPHPHPSEC